MICKTCFQPVRYDEETGEYYHQLSEENRQLETIAREVRDPLVQTVQGEVLDG